MDRLDRKDLKHAPFDVVLRGYDKRQVDERIRFLGAELTAAENALRTAQARIAALEEELSQARSGASGPESNGSGPGADTSFGARVEKIITTAEEEARAVRSQAGVRAAVLVEQAKAEAAEHRRRAEQEIAARQAETEQASAAAAREADELRRRAAQEADELRRAAAQEADEVRKKARAQAHQRIQEARIEADRLVASANDAAGQRERASVQELQRLSQLRDQVNAELYRAKNVLDSLFPSTVKDAGGPAVAEPDGRVSQR